ncbi:hypothetical protein WICPIJ_003029 [Wickerhamomyces pijperi]|uniref:Uncharacterized protein n=1 Tax=Wickerhamomyces pijperi TaxID=599730 RepID=A0A9P8TPB2_WICPI|nr:hypothetical protein WICPIJ_003029 [Wickerhamomyces pijperi]
MSLPFTDTPVISSNSPLPPPPYSSFSSFDQSSVFAAISKNVDLEVPALLSFAAMVFIIDQLLAPNTVYCSLFSILLLSFLILIQCKYKSLLVIIYLNGVFVSFIGIGNCINDILALELLTKDTKAANDTMAFIAQLFSLQISGAFNQIILHALLITISTLVIFIGVMIAMDEEFYNNVFKLNAGLSLEKEMEEQIKLSDMV